MKGYDIKAGRGGSRRVSGVLKKCDIGRYEVLMCIEVIVAIALLKPGITKEDAVHGHS